MAERKRGLVLSGGGGRGAYQAGVYKYLEEIGFVPDIIAGTSVGAINAVAIASGMKAFELCELWAEINSDDVFRLSFWKTIWRFLVRSFSPLADITPLKRLLEAKLNLENLRTSNQQIFISAVNILTAELKFYTNRDIEIPHILASSAIPLVFPWQYIDGMPYWDGGLMANTPIQPVIEAGAREIVVILLSPVGGKTELGLPRSKRESIERVFELSLIGSYQLVSSYLHKEKEKVSRMNFFEQFLYTFGHDSKGVKIYTLSPSEPLGLGSIMRFTPGQSRKLIEKGYTDARKKGLFK